MVIIDPSQTLRYVIARNVTSLWEIPVLTYGSIGLAIEHVKPVPGLFILVDAKEKIEDIKQLKSIYKNVAVTGYSQLKEENFPFLKKPIRIGSLKAR